MKNYETIKDDATKLAKTVSEEYLNDWSHKVEGDTIVLTLYNGSADTVVVPGQIGGKAVKIDTTNPKFSSRMNGVFANMSTTTVKFLPINNTKVTIKDNAAGMFANARKLQTVDFKGLDLSAATNIDALFQASKVTSVDLSGQDLGKVTSAEAMFQTCTKLTIVNFGDSLKDASGLTNMSSMFSGDTELTSLDLTNVNTSAVTNMKNMFQSCSKLTDLKLNNEQFGSAVTEKDGYNNIDKGASEQVKNALKATKLADKGYTGE